MTAEFLHEFTKPMKFEFLTYELEFPTKNKSYDLYWTEREEEEMNSDVYLVLENIGAFIIPQEIWNWLTQPLHTNTFYN